MVDTLWPLPEGWEWVALGNPNLVEIVMGQSPPSKTYNTMDQGLPFFQGKAEFGDLYPSPVKWCSSPTKIGLIGDVLISVRAPVGPTNLVKEECCIGRGLAGLRPKGNLETFYLLYCLRCLETQISGKGRGSAFNSISKTDIAQFKIPIPYPNNPKLSLDIQRRIVARIESLLGEIKRNRLLLEQMRLDNDLLLPNALDEVIERLDSKRQTLLDVIQEKPRNGWSPKWDNNPDGVPVLFQYNPDEIKRTSLPTDKNAHYWLEAGDILISRSNTLDLVGHTSIYSGIPYPCIYPDLMMRFRVNPNKADSKFLIYWLQSKEVRHYIQKNASGASPTMKKIKQETVCNIPFPIINIEEQSYFAYHLDAIQQEVSKISKIIEEDQQSFNYLEQAILEKAFRGEL
jgi:type I restriction enzyme S subunit